MEAVKESASALATAPSLASSWEELPPAVVPRNFTTIRAINEELGRVHVDIAKLEWSAFFLKPVTVAEAGEVYFDVIKEPMDLATMASKLTKHAYQSLEEYKADFVLMCKNAMTFNETDSIVYQHAKELLSRGTAMIDAAHKARADVFDGVLREAVFSKLRKRREEHAKARRTAGEQLSDSIRLDMYTDPTVSYGSAVSAEGDNGTTLSAAVKEKLAAIRRRKVHLPFHFPNKERERFHYRLASAMKPFSSVKSYQHMEQNWNHPIPATPLTRHLEHSFSPHVDSVYANIDDYDGALLLSNTAPWVEPDCSNGLSVGEFSRGIIQTVARMTAALSQAPVDDDDDNDGANAQKETATQVKGDKGKVPASDKEACDALARALLSSSKTRVAEKSDGNATKTAEGSEGRGDGAALVEALSAAVEEPLVVEDASLHALLKLIQKRVQAARAKSDNDPDTTASEQSNEHHSEVSKSEAAEELQTTAPETVTATKTTSSTTTATGAESAEVSDATTSGTDRDRSQVFEDIDVAGIEARSDADLKATASMSTRSILALNRAVLSKLRNEQISRIATGQPWQVKARENMLATTFVNNIAIILQRKQGNDAVIDKTGIRNLLGVVVDESVTAHLRAGQNTADGGDSWRSTLHPLRMDTAALVATERKRAHSVSSVPTNASTSMVISEQDGQIEAKRAKVVMVGGHSQAKADSSARSSAEAADSETPPKPEKKLADAAVETLGERKSQTKHCVPGEVLCKSCGGVGLRFGAEITRNTRRRLEKMMLGVPIDMCHACGVYWLANRQRRPVHFDPRDECTLVLQSAPYMFRPS